MTTLRPQNGLALAALILGVVTAILVVLRPYWLVPDLVGVAAIALGIAGLVAADRMEGTGRAFAIAAIILGCSPLVPLVLVMGLSEFSYY